jgi:putative toxin-antitoxin system antitoxin component (TIGR02293 family)
MKAANIYEDSFRAMDLTDDYALVTTAHQGIGIHYFDQLLEASGIQKGILASLVGVDPRTVDNYRKNQKKFDTLEGEQLLKLGRLFLFGEEVFESMDDLRKWLDTESVGLGNIKPLILLNTSTGVDLVYDELKRIEEGYVV